VRDIALPQLVGVWFQILLTPLIGVLFIVQSPYWSTIGRRGVLSLGGWAPLLHTEFHELRATLERQPRVQVFAYRTITFYGFAFQQILLTIPLFMSASTTPESKLSGLGYSAFARRY
jgi:hypothetical protein